MEGVETESVALIGSDPERPGRVGSSRNDLPGKVAATLERFTDWLDSYGATSWDHQSFFAGAVGSKAKELYYRHGLSRDLDKSKFIGAYEGESLVGFIKLNIAEGRFANPGLIVSKLEARKKYVNNGLIAKAVELCTAASIPYLTYTIWRRGTQAEFLIRHGFQKISVPRYWIPLTKKGAIAFKLGLHRNIRAYIPDPIYQRLLRAKGAINNWRHKTAPQENE